MSAALELVVLHQQDLRRRLPEDRKGKSHSFVIAGHHINLRTGEYDDGSLGEIFLEVSKAGSTMSGLLDAFATSVSIALQYRVPLSVLCDKFIDSSYEPRGITDNAEIREAKSILDYCFRWLRARY